MSKIRLIRQAHLDKLKEAIKPNIPAYAAADASHFPDPEMVSFEIDITADLDALSELRPSKAHADEVFNCLLVNRALKDVRPELARDERLWTYVTHYHALEYASGRWPVDEDDLNQETYVLNHYFAHTKRGVERDNAISRLWWMAFIADKAESGTLEENLDALLQFSDVRANIIERPSTGRSSKILSAVLEKLREAHVIYKKTGDKGLFERQTFRKMMSGINALGGYVMLDALAPSHLSAILSQLISSPKPEDKSRTESGPERVSLSKLIQSVLYSKS